VIRYEEALDRVRRMAHPLSPEWVRTEEAAGRVLSAGVASPGSLPPFTNSAMDGFALATGGEELAPGSAFEVGGRALAGDTPGAATEDGRAWEIATGAPLPRGMDAVVPLERVEVERVEGGDGVTRRIRLLASVGPGQNIRVEGEDFRAGEPVVEAGRRLGPVELMTLSALGVGRVQIRRPPRAMVLCTGDELEGNPEAALGPGQIRDSGGPFLRAVLERQGVARPAVRTVPDRLEPFLRVVSEARDQGADFLISTGAVSKGRRDFVPDALARLSGRVLFHGTTIRPGKPLLVGVLPGEVLLFGLPGNPVSTVVGFRFFVQPYLRSLLGEAPELPWQLPLLNEVRKGAGYRAFHRARVEVDTEGRVGVRTLPGQEAFRLRSLLESDAWAALPEDATDLPAGSLVEVYGLLEPFPLGASRGSISAPPSPP
jgi:molybdopterin molybdotransferase